jgi:thiamine biosynthesis lipoprotein
MLQPIPERGNPSVMIAAALLASAFLATCGQGSRHPVLALEGTTMGTTYSVQIVDPPEAVELDALRRRIDAELEQVNAEMSTYRDDSQLSRFNAAATADWFPVSEALAAIVEAALEIGRVSGGALDVTVGPLVNLWGFGPTPSADQVPDDAAIAAARAHTGLDKLGVRPAPPALRKDDPALTLDLSAIAKGHGVDRVAELLAREGIENLLVEIGGEVYGRGHNGRGEPWRIAIERPRSEGRSLLRIVPLRDIGMATSGDYRNFFELDGVRYSHTIDPATGHPVRHNLAAVTVLADSAMAADAWATALLVLGPERGPELAAGRGLAALFITRGDDDRLSVQTTPAFDALVAKPAG